MNKKGVTVVEVIVSFSLTVVIFIFLMQIIVNLTKVYSNNDKKTQLLTKQAIISDGINTVLMDKKLINIEKTEENVYRFYYATGDRDTLRINNGKVFRFNELGVELDDAKFGDISVDVIYSPTLKTSSNNAIFILTIPIISDLDYNFDVKVIYQFNTENSNIDEYFDSI